jgi:hypothetical protein
MPAGQTTILTTIGGVPKSVLAGSDGVNVAPGHANFDASGNPHGVTANPFVTKPVASTLAYTVSESVTVTATSGIAVPAGTCTTTLTLQNTDSVHNIWINPTGGAAVVGAGCLISAGGGSYTFGGIANPVPTSNITAISDGGSPNLAVMGG